MTSQPKIHINQSSFLTGIIQEAYPSISHNTIFGVVKDLDEVKYKFLLALHYKKKKAELDVELFKLGILN